MTENSSYSQFDALTLEGILHLENILDLLSNELQALTERDLDEIKRFTQLKHEVLNKFTANLESRQNHLHAVGIGFDKASITLFLADSPNNAKQYSQNWLKLETLLSDVIAANSVNEQVLKRNQKNIDTILSILQGQKASNILYDAKGDKGDYAGQSRIGKA